MLQALNFRIGEAGLTSGLQIERRFEFWGTVAGSDLRVKDVGVQSVTPAQPVKPVIADGDMAYLLT